MSAESAAWDRVRSGDPDSFGQIFDLHRDRVYAQALRLMKTTHDAEDVVALVFLEAWRRRATVRLVEGSALPWLLVTTNFVVRNAARTARRHRFAMSKLPPQDHEPDPSDEILARMDDTARLGRLQQGFVKLAKADQDILTLCVVNEFSTAQAAEALGVPLGTVKSRLSRAKQRLAALTGSPLPEDVSTPALGEIK
ncbi:DNA-directed RNA polymerase sigma-70 factor [Frondihabitans sucicola]|uniref:DNA-directed RNA polymerase sigma-70 factor n=1 Tax=Frondihabitans sucicola TaxID=1268041 RepID=A0ABM8GKQ4_9MICO|nr:RNA polymerase sigma factor [Frondihabitans sucicola]BDZ48963.1 DNA-directed RNA polymerase sigma-70 factor [Frondihabitans sucicola]